MQLIAEAYWVMKKLLDLTNEEMADVFARWNEGKLRSYLIEITANILRHKDKSGGYLIDKILDAPDRKEPANGRLSTLWNSACRWD